MSNGLPPPLPSSPPGKRGAPDVVGCEGMEIVGTAVDVVCDEDDGVVVFSLMVPGDEEEGATSVEVATMVEDALPMVEDALPMVVVDVANTVLDTIVVEVHEGVDCA